MLQSLNMASQSVIPRPSNLFAHRTLLRNNSVLYLPQSGGGLGNILRSFFKWIIPAGKTALSTSAAALKTAAKSKLAKEAASALKQEATTAGINLVQSALKGNNVKDTVISQSKQAANNVGSSISKSLEQYRPEASSSPASAKPKPKKKLQKKKMTFSSSPIPAKKIKKKDNLS